MATVEELKAQLDGMSRIKLRFVARIIESLADPPEAMIREARTWLTASEDWLEYFGLALSVHHATTDEALGLGAFEMVFRNACHAVGWETDPPGAATRRFVDVHVLADAGSPRRLSLKSTAAKRISETSAHVSKLTEAAWIQDVRTAGHRRERTLSLFQDYVAAVDAILMLRAFRSGGVPHRYQLIEIPSSFFRQSRMRRWMRSGRMLP